MHGLDELIARIIPIKQPDPEQNSSRRYLLIYTNENELEYEEEPKEAEPGEPQVALPRSLKAGILKDHQLKGFGWLQRMFRRERRGCLLADDMGLGKTLQVLAFLAWLIEEGELDAENPNPDAARRWNPILIVSPVTLLENETWIEDMRKFFADDGEVFLPWLPLHGSRLRELRKKGIEGRETAIGEAMLDLERLRQHRVVLTNYETVVNYQHSFARMKDHWSVIVRNYIKGINV